MGLKYLVYSEKKMYSTAIQMLLDELKKTNQIFESFAELKEELAKVKGCIVILGPHSETDPYILCQEVSHTYPLSSVVMLLKEEQIDYKKGMFSGAVDLLDIGSDEDEIIKSLHKAEEVIYLKIKGDKASKGIVSEAKVITVCSTKGGVGKTTISVNLAVAFQKQNLKIAVIDLDLQFGDVALLFDLQSTKTIYDWIKQSYENGDKSYDRFLLKHKTGIHILASPTLPEFSELIKGEHVAYLIEDMKKDYDIIVIDTPPSFVETSLVALEHSDLILLIASMDLPALKNGKLALETLHLLGLTSKIHVIINRDGTTNGMSKEMVENVLGRKIEGSIPSDYFTVIESINKGESFVLSEPRSSVAKAMMSLSMQLLNITPSDDLTRKKEKGRKGFSLFKPKRK